MYDVILRYVPNLRAEGSEIAIILLVIVEHFALLCGAQAVQSIHQHGFTSTGATNQGHEFTGRYRQRDIIDEGDLLVTELLEMKSINVDIATLIKLH